MPAIKPIDIVNYIKVNVGFYTFDDSFFLIQCAHNMSLCRPIILKQTHQVCRKQQANMYIFLCIEILHRPIYEKTKISVLILFYVLISYVNSLFELLFIQIPFIILICASPSATFI